MKKLICVLCVLTLLCSTVFATSLFSDNYLGVVVDTGFQIDPNSNTWLDASGEAGGIIVSNYFGNSDLGSALKFSIAIYEDYFSLDGAIDFSYKSSDNAYGANLFVNLGGQFSKVTKSGKTGYYLGPEAEIGKRSPIKRFEGCFVSYSLKTDYLFNIAGEIVNNKNSFIRTSIVIAAGYRF